MALRKGDRVKYNTLIRACKVERLALFESRLASTGEYRALVCAMSNIEGSTDMRPVPVAVMVWDNPYELFVDPETLPQAQAPKVEPHDPEWDDTNVGEDEEDYVSHQVPGPNSTEVLEGMIDRFGLYEVLMILDTLCSDKAAHIRANGGPGDKALARRWDSAALACKNAATNRAVLGVS